MDPLTSPGKRNREDEDDHLKPSAKVTKSEADLGDTSEGALAPTIPLTDEYLDGIDNDKERLNEFIQECEHQIGLLDYATEREKLLRIVKLQGKAEGFLKILTEIEKKTSAKGTTSDNDNQEAKKKILNISESMFEQDFTCGC